MYFWLRREHRRHEGFRGDHGRPGPEVRVTPQICEHGRVHSHPRVAAVISRTAPGQSLCPSAHEDAGGGRHSPPPPTAAQWHFGEQRRHLHNHPEQGRHLASSPQPLLRAEPPLLGGQPSGRGLRGTISGKAGDGRSSRKHSAPRGAGGGAGLCRPPRRGSAKPPNVATVKREISATRFSFRDWIPGREEPSGSVRGCAPLLACRGLPPPLPPTAPPPRFAGRPVRPRLQTYFAY